MTFEMTKWRRIYCSVFGCLNSTITHPEYTFFKIPNDPERRVKWLRLMSREDLISRPANSHSVCEVHFNAMDVMPGSKRKILKHTAVPVLHLPASQLIDVQTQTDVIQGEIVKIKPPYSTYNDMSTTAQPIDNCESEALVKAENEYDDMDLDIQENPIESFDPEIKLEPDEEAPTTSSSKRKLDDVLDYNERVLKQIEAQSEGKDMFFELCNTYMTQELAKLPKAQKNFENKDHPDYIMFCMNMYQTSPPAYIPLLQNILNLPPPETLTSFIPITSGMNETIISILKTKAKNMTDAEKNCAMVLSTINLKEHLFYDIKEDKIIGFEDVDGVQTTAVAKTALVITIRGIVSNWTQPISYALLSKCPNYDNIAKWMDNLLDQLYQIGLEVRTFVSNREPNIYGKAKIRTVSVEKPYFVINNRTVCYIFDPYLLLNEVRDNFVRYDFYYQNKVAKSEHVRKLYDFDKVKADRLAPKLTESDTKPSVKRNKDCSPTQLFSKDVATALSTYIDFEVIDQSGKDTVHFIKLMNSLLDALNTASLDNYEKRRPFLAEMLSFFRGLKLIDPTNGKDVTSQANFIRSFQITIKSILLLHEHLKMEGITSLPTKRLNHEGIGFWGTKKPNGEMRIARRLLNVYRKSFYSNIKKPTKGRACDTKKILVSLKQRNDETFSKADRSEPAELDEFDTIPIASSEYNKLDIPRKYALLFISGFLLGKCREYHRECKILDSYIKSFSYDSRQKGNYKRYFQYSSSRNKPENLLAIPNDDFIGYVEILEDIFRVSFEGRHVNLKIAASIYRDIRHINITQAPCPCFPEVFMKKLFIRMRIFITMQSMNQRTKSNIGRKVC